MKTCNNICATGLGNGSSGFQWFLLNSDVGLIIGCCQDIVGDFCHVFRLFFFFFKKINMPNLLFNWPFDCGNKHEPFLTARPTSSHLIFNPVKIDKSGKSKQFDNKQAQICIKGNEEAGLEWVYLYGTADQGVEKSPPSLFGSVSSGWLKTKLPRVSCPACISASHPVAAGSHSRWLWLRTSAC